MRMNSKDYSQLGNIGSGNDSSQWQSPERHSMMPTNENNHIQFSVAEAPVNVLITEPEVPSEAEIYEFDLSSSPEEIRLRFDSSRPLGSNNFGQFVLDEASFPSAFEDTLRPDQSGQFIGEGIDIIKFVQSYETLSKKGVESLRKEFKIKETVTNEKKQFPEETQLQLKTLCLFPFSQLLARNNFASKIFQDVVKPNEIQKIVDRHEGIHVYYFLYGFLGHYFLHFFGNSRRIDPTSIRYTDPLTRCRIRKENNANEQMKKVFFSETFNIKEFIGICIKRFFSKAACWDNNQRLVTLQILEAMLGYGLYSGDEVRGLVDYLGTISAQCKDTEKHFKSKFYKKEDLYPARQYVSYIFVHLMTLINDFSVYSELGGDLCFKNPDKKETLTPIEDGATLKNIWHEQTELSMNMSMVLFEYCILNNEVFCPHHACFFGMELLHLYMDSYLEPFQLSLTNVTQEALNEKIYQEKDRQKTRERLLKVQSAIIKRVLSRNDNPHDTLEIENAIDVLIADGTHLLSHCSQISGFLLSLIVTLNQIGLRNLAPKAIAFLEEVVLGCKYNFISIFSNENFYSFKQFGLLHSLDLFSMILKVSRKFGSEFLFSIMKFIEWLMVFIEQGENLTMIISGRNKEYFKNSLVFLTSLTALINGFDSRKSHPLYEEVCARIQAKLLDKFGIFMTEIWPELQKEETFQNYSTDWEKPDAFVQDPLFLKIKVLRLLVVVTREFRIKEKEHFMWKYRIPKFISTTPRLIFIYGDILELWSNNSLQFVNASTSKEVNKTLKDVIKAAKSLSVFVESLPENFKDIARRKGRYGFLIPMIKALKKMMMLVLSPRLCQASVLQCHNIQVIFPDLANISTTSDDFECKTCPVLKLSDDFIVPMDQLKDQSEIDEIGVVKHRVIISYTLEHLERLLIESKSAFLQVYRPYTSRYCELSSFITKKQTENWTEIKNKIEEKLDLEHSIDSPIARALVSAYRRAKEKIAQKSTPIIVTSFDKSIEMRENIKSFLFKQLQIVTDESRSKSWFSKHSLFFYIDLFNMIIEGSKGFRKQIFDEHLMMLPYIEETRSEVEYNKAYTVDEEMLALKKEVSLNIAEKIEGQGNEDQLAPDRPRLLDQLHQLHVIYYERVIEGMFHTQIFPLWKKRYHAISNLFQNLCEQNFLPFKELIGSRLVLSTRESMAVVFLRKFVSSHWTSWIFKNETSFVHPFSMTELADEMVLTWDYLTELLIGPCRRNQKIFSKHYQDFVDAIKQEKLPPDHYIWKVVNSILTFLIALHEDQRRDYYNDHTASFYSKQEMVWIKDYVKTAYISALNSKQKVKRLKTPKLNYCNLIEMYKVSKEFSNSIVLDCGLLYFELICLFEHNTIGFKDVFDKYHELGKIAKRKPKIEGETEETYECVSVYCFLRKVFRTIEVYPRPGQKSLRRVYFATNPEFWFFPKKALEDFISQADLENRSAKFVWFFDQRVDFMVEMKFNRMLYARHGLIYWLFSPSKFWMKEWFNFYYSTVINIVVFVSFSWNESEENPNEEKFGASKGWVEDLITALLSAGIVWNLALIGGWCFVKFLPTYRVILLEFKRKNPSYKEKGVPLFVKGWLAVFNSFLLQNGILNSLIILFTSTVFLITNSPVWLVFQVMSILNLLKPAGFVYRAITEKWGYFLSTALLAIFIVYFYAAILAEFYSNHLLEQDIIGEGGVILEGQSGFCSTLAECFLHTMNLGLLTGSGTGGELYLQGYESLFWHYMARYVFDMSFFIIVDVLILNIVAGIVIDSFAELRDASNQKGKIPFGKPLYFEEIKKNSQNPEK